MTDLEQRLFDFSRSLDDFKPTDSASWQLAQIFNALLAEVKKVHGDDPIVDAITPVEQSMSGGAVADCGTLNAATAQLLAIVRE